MSLDIYAKLKDKTIIEHNAVDGSYCMWGTEEKMTKLTDQTPTVFRWNITHNLGEMASHVPIAWTAEDGKTYDTDLYHILWRPEEVFVDKEEITLRDLKEPLRIGMMFLLEHEEDLKPYNPENYWGHYDNFVRLLPNYYRACCNWPEAVVGIWR